MKYSFWQTIKASRIFWGFIAALITLFMFLSFLGPTIALFFYFSILLNLIKRDIASSYIERCKVLPIKKRNLFLGRNLAIWAMFISYLIVYTLLFAINPFDELSNFIKANLVLVFMALNLYTVFLYLTDNKFSLFSFLKNKYKNVDLNKVLYVILFALWIVFIVLLSTKIEFIISTFQLLKNTGLLTFNIFLYVILTLVYILFVSRD